jgi:A/G-specific adenine glycosylase
MVSKKQFQKIVLDFYRRCGRHDLPWRMTTDPYKILISEIMLQQTQVDRVIPKYKLFIKTFPKIQTLAQAPTSDVLTLWSGLGYNRRALQLKRATEIVSSQYKGIFPKTYSELVKLPGVGPYTAGAITAFAYNQESFCIETNIRTVFIYHFYKDQKKVSDKEILLLLQKTMPTKDFRIWYWALMDYGSYLKKTIGNISKKSSTYVKQKPFKTSDRYIRGHVLKVLTMSQKAVKYKNIFKEKEFSCTFAYFKTVLTQLHKEGLIKIQKEYITLP